MPLRTTMLRAITTAIVAVGSVITGASSADAAGAADPFCNHADRVAVGNGWSALVPTVVHRTGQMYLRCYLKEGDAYHGVGVLQSQLAYCYGADLQGTSIFGTKTKAALQRAQRLQGITADGVYGPETLKALKWRLSRWVDGRLVQSTKCYQPFAAGTITASPLAGSYSPYCSAPTERYAGNAWWATLPATMTRTGSRHFACYLKQGDRSSAVRVLQENLRSCYRASVAVDGYYGPQTKAAVERIQRLHGIRIDGIYGPATMKAMNWRLLKFPIASQRCYSPF